MISFIISFTLVIASSLNLPIEKMKNSFGMIQVGVKVVPIDPENVDLLAISIMNNIIDSPFMRASSFIVKHKKEKTIHLTSEHVCTEILKFQKPEKFKSIKDSVISAAIISDLFSNTKLEDQINVIPNIYVKDFFGNKYSFDKVIKTDNKSDLCKFTTHTKWGNKSEINELDCSYGERVYNIASSGGFYSKNSVPFREGNFSGIYLEKENNEKIKRNLYTIESLPGSSGSGVYSKNGKLCGNINISYSKSNLSLGATRIDLIEFLKN
mgnify:CR=1 FL=1|tara:strand:- start:157 stop:957 length:801 start_codon:yes stop_codon:yes gene_type:complete